MAWNLNRAVQHLQANAQPNSIGRCAQYTREAIEAGGLTLTRHGSAKDYGSSLTEVGFEAVSQIVPQIGDVVVIQGFDGHPHGHMAMFDGTSWISDFKQNGLYPGSAYRTHKPSYQIYRYPGASGQTLSNPIRRVLRLDNPLMRGEDVGQLQTALIAQGYKIVADDVFGSETDRAVRNFQARSGLKADGIVGSRTRKALGI